MKPKKKQRKEKQRNGNDGKNGWKRWTETGEEETDRVRAHVDFELGALGETVAARLATERLLVGVRAQVLQKVALERAMANRTLERLHAAVIAAQVLAQTVAPRERLSKTMQSISIVWLKPSKKHVARVIVVRKAFHIFPVFFIFIKHWLLCPRPPAMENLSMKYLCRLDTYEVDIMNLIISAHDLMSIPEAPPLLGLIG